MCGRSSVGHKPGLRTRRGLDHARVAYRPGPRGTGAFFGLDVEKMSPRAQVAAALAVLAPVALSGVFFTFIGVWWVFTTYFWISFPAFGLLARGLAGMSEARPARITPETRERQLLGALQAHGELTPAGAAAQTSLTVAEADGMLKELAEGGHLEVRVRGGGLFYALWEAPRGDGDRASGGRRAGLVAEPAAEGRVDREEISG